MPPKIDQHRSDGASWAKLAARVSQKSLGKHLGNQKDDLEGCLEPFGPPRGRQDPATGAPLAYSRSAGEG